MWLDLLPTFTATHRTYLVDAIGEPGRSTTTVMLHGSDDVTRWLDGLLDGLGTERAAVVGLSNGGFQAATYATDRPARASSASPPSRRPLCTGRSRPRGGGRRCR